jgi:5-methyltetrahydrofolate--homocysteine methyltransferase
MKRAVSWLEPHMAKAASRSRGKVILATVKGDVHDIGKNLVDIILSNNGFEVVDLGIKVPSEILIQAVREHRPDVLGLSGLLVKSAQQMVLTAGDLAAEGLAVPLLVGGAALTRRFTHRKIAPAYGGAFCTYAGDAMTGLGLVERLCDGEAREELALRVAEEAERDRALDTPGGAAAGDAAGRTATAGPSPAVRRDLEPPPPPDLERHVEVLPLREVWGLVNPQMLYAKHLGLKGSIERLREAGDPKLAMLEEVVRGLEVEALAESERTGLGARAVWRFFPARAEGDAIVLLDPDDPQGEPAARWSFPRQTAGERLCLADYVLSSPSGVDHVALFVTTFGPRPGAGPGASVRERAEAWKHRGEYLKSHAFSALALETAEAAAEHVHRKLRALWGFPDPPELEERRLFQARYRGKRYSFGYPACPDLEGQRALFRALAPEEIGVELTEGDMMDPEASVSALVFHHPDARYFGG